MIDLLILVIFINIKIYEVMEKSKKEKRKKNNFNLKVYFIK